MAKKRVYVESTVISYLTARPARDIVKLAHQQLTAEWWDRRHAYRLFASPLVLEEIMRGDPEAARLRVEKAGELELLPPTDDARALAEGLVAGDAVPDSVRDDATHIALAAVHRMDFLLTWNHRHIINAEKLKAIREVVVRAGYEPPLLVTPEALLEDRHDE